MYMLRHLSDPVSRRETGRQLVIKLELLKVLCGHSLDEFIHFLVPLSLPPKPKPTIKKHPTPKPSRNMVFIPGKQSKLEDSQ